MASYLVMFEDAQGKGDVQICDEDRLNQYVEFFKQKNKNKDILVCKLIERVTTIVDIKYAHYVYNDKGEVLPK